MGEGRKSVMKTILENTNPFCEARGQSVDLSQEQVSSLLGLGI